MKKKTLKLAGWRAVASCELNAIFTITHESV